MDETLANQAGDLTWAACLEIKVEPILLDAGEASSLEPTPDHPEQPAPVVISLADGLTSAAFLQINTFQLRSRQGEPSP
jgi:hypothetical protein